MTRKLPRSRREARGLLGAELRRLRELAGLRGAAMAAVIGKSAPTVSLIESGDRAISAEQVQAWVSAVLDVVPDALSADDTAYLDQVAAKATAEISPLSGTLAVRQSQVAELEEAATAIRNWQPFYVPGLFQTPDYARAMFTMISAPEEVAGGVAGRIARQAILGDSSRQFEFITTQQGLCWRPAGPDPRPAQLDRLAAVARLPNVSLLVIPSGAVMHSAPVGPFVVYEDDDGEGQTYIELLDREVFPPGKPYQDELVLLRQSALSEEDSLAFIRDLAARLADG